MKKIILLTVTILGLVLSGCKKDELPNATTYSVSNEKITETSNSVSINGSYVSTGTISKMSIVYGLTGNMNLSNTCTMNNQEFSVNITGLDSNTKYYYCFEFMNEYSSARTIVKSFKTLDFTVTTKSVSNITQNSATCGGNVTSDGGATVTARGVCWSTSQNPTTSNSHTTDGSGTGSFTSSITGLTANTTYFVRSYATNNKGTSYGEQKSFKTHGSIGGHEYVDLGLPSGLLWATCNIGADSPQDYGDYFAWGETETKTYFDWDHYKWGSGNHFTKYNQYDGLTTLEPADDAAHVIWGASWRMPTSSEFRELINQCTWIWTTQNGINGRLVTGPSKNSIFLPSDGISDYYYSSSLGYPSINACYLYLGGVKVNDSYRCFGCFIRPVRQP